MGVWLISNVLDSNLYVLFVNMYFKKSFLFFFLYLFKKRRLKKINLICFELMEVSFVFGLLC